MNGSLCRLWCLKLDVAIPLALVVLIQRHFCTKNITKLSESIEEILMTPLRF